MNIKDTDLIQKIKDPKFYLENFCQIKTKDRGLAPFILKEAQKDLFNTLKHNNRVIILKARQMGFSSAVTGYLYHKTITTPGVNTALIGYNSELTMELLDKVKTFHRTTPESIRPKIQYNSKSEISFPAIDSKIIVLPSTENVGRGYTLHNVLLTELSAWEKAEEKMSTLEASVPIGGQIIIESCVTGDTIVLTENGLVFVEDIHDWENNSLGFSEGKKILLDGHYGLKPTKTYYNSGIKNGYRIKTKHGYELGMSSVHKLYVLRGEKLEFIESKNLRIGDFLAIKYGQEIWGNNNSIDWEPTQYGFNKGFIKLFNPKEITSDLAYLLGLILGDGYIDFKQGRVVVTTIDDDVSSFLLNQPFGLRFKQSNGDDYYHYICKNESFVEFLNIFIGWKKTKAPKKEIPVVVLSWSRDNVVSFLQGLFDADGSCRKDRGSVSFISTSKKMIDVLRVILLNFGIISRTYTYNAPPSKKVKVWSSGYKLEIEESHSIIFLEKIGFRIKRKQDCGKILRKYNFCRLEKIPGVGLILKKYMKELGLKYSDISRGLNKSFYSKSGDITYKILGMILDICRNKESKTYEDIKELYDKKYYYDNIVSIVPIEENVYDFTVDDGHTVTYSGIIGHQTPRGIGNVYHRMWMADDNDYIKKEYGWWWDYTEEEIKTIERRMNNPSKFAQEYSLEFLASGRMVFDQMAVRRQRKNVLLVGDNVKAPDGTEYKVRISDDLRIYREPEMSKLYVVGADVAEGVDGGDYSVAVILDRMTGEEVAFFKGHIEPDKFGAKLNAWGRRYNNALMIPEINNHGLTTVTVLKQLIYPSMYFRPAHFEKIASAWGVKLGWKTTKLTRPLLIDDFAQAVRDETLIIHSKEILDEMSTFIYDASNNMKPQPGFHDDTIMATGIGYQGFKVLYDKPLTQLNYASHLPSGFSY